MNDRSKRHAFRIRMEAMIIGAALASPGDKEKILNSFGEDSFLHSGQWAFKAIKEGNRESFADLMAFWGVELGDGERAIDAIIRTCQAATEADRAQTIVLSMLRSIKHDSSAEDIAEVMQESLDVINTKVVVCDHS